MSFSRLNCFQESLYPLKNLNFYNIIYKSFLYFNNDLILEN